MSTRTLVKIQELEIEGQAYTVYYFEGRTSSGKRRYSSELALRPGDCVIFDGNSLSDLECKVPRLMPATLHSRALGPPPRSSEKGDV
jgi:hypothetical protein